MLRAARAAAANAKLDVRFIQTAIEDLDCGDESFDFVTIGRALHWLPREATLTVLERIVAAGGCIAVCGSAATDVPGNAWAAKFKEVRMAWAADQDRSRYKIDADEWFAASRFRKIDEIAVEHRHRISIPELIGRALSFSVTSPAVLGERRAQYEGEMKEALEPFAIGGTVEEEVVAKATVLGRTGE
jgi:hypothetical protein